MFLAFSCKEEKKEISSKVKNSDIVNFVNSWNDSHNKKDLAAFSNLYADNVLYYGTEKKKSQIVVDKERLLNKYSDFKQVIVNKDLDINDEENGKNVKFIKTVTFDSKQKDYPSYLFVSNINGEWKITAESDELTDASISQKESKTNKVLEIEEDDKLYGDFNGDGSKEYVWIEGPKLPNPEDYDDWDKEYDFRSDYCIGGCNSVVYFSNKQIIPITVFDTYGGMLVNLGDLNNNGTEEIGVWTRPGYMTGSTSSLNIFDTKNFRKTLIEPFSLNFNLHDYAIKDAVKNLGNKKIEITESIFTEDATYELRKRTIVLE
jgi:hypothetical protein